MVERSPHNPKVEASNLVPDIGKEKMEKERILGNRVDPGELS